MPRPVPAWAPARDLKGQPEPRYGLHATAEAGPIRCSGASTARTLGPTAARFQRRSAGAMRSQPKSATELALGHGGGAARTAVN